MAGLPPGCRRQNPVVVHGRHWRAPQPAAVGQFKLGKPDIVLIISGGTSGMIEACNCPLRMTGGLASRGGLVTSYRAIFDNVFVLDSGDLFSIEPDHFLNGFVVKGYGLIGYDAVVLGDQEWSARPDNLRRFLAEADIAYLSTTVGPGAAHAPLPVRRETTKQLGKIKLAVLADVSEGAFQFSLAASKRTVRAPKEELAQRVKRLKADGYFVVVVSHGDGGDTDTVAQSCDADLIVRGHSSRSRAGIRRVGLTPIVKVGGRQTVGVVAIKIGADGAPSQMEFRIEVLDDHWPTDMRLIQMYQTFARRTTGPAGGTTQTVGPRKYVGSEACGKCHSQRYSAWRASAHARSLKSLSRLGHDKDAACLPCHTSGYGARGGFSADRTEGDSALGAVTCQSCHNMEVDSCESKSFMKARPRVTEDVCTSCHTPFTDPMSAFRRVLTSKQCAQ